MFYLEMVIAVIENEKYIEAVRQLGEKLQSRGMGLLCLGEEYLKEFLARMNSGETLQAVVESVLQGTAMQNVSLQDTPVLWLSDNAACVTALREAGHAVLAYLHCDNGEQNFSAARYACEEPQELDAEYMDRVFRRCMRLPWDILQTGRCFIRETVPEDAEVFYKIYAEPSITRYTEGLFEEMAQEKQYINDYIDKVYSFYDCGVWTILKDDTDEIIGRAGFSFREGYELPEIGFVIGVPWQGQGYAEEVCRAILQYGWEELGFTTVQAFVKPENQASLALCRKLGMEKAGQVLIDGEVHVQMVCSRDMV